MHRASVGMNEIQNKPEAELQKGCAVSQRTLQGIPKGHPFADNGDDPDAKEPLARGSAVRQVGPEREVHDKKNQAVPVGEVKHQMDIILEDYAKPGCKPYTGPQKEIKHTEYEEEIHAESRGTALERRQARPVQL